MQTSLLLTLAFCWLIPWMVDAKHHSYTINCLLDYHKAITRWAKLILADTQFKEWLALEDFQSEEDIALLFPGHPPNSAQSPSTTIHTPNLINISSDDLLQLSSLSKFQKQDINISDGDDGLFCLLGVAVYDNPQVTCGGEPASALDYVTRPEANCQVSGPKICICPIDAAHYKWRHCAQVRPLKCQPVLVDPELSCPSSDPGAAKGDPKCFSINRRQSVTFKYRLKCTVDGEIWTADPSDSSKMVPMSQLEPAELIELTGTPYLSADGKHYASAEWYRQQFTYQYHNDDYTLAVSLSVPGQIPSKMYLKIWDFIHLSDDSNKQYSSNLTTDHIVGDSLIAFDVDFAKVDDAFLVGGRAYLEAAFDIHRGASRLLVDINNYVVRHRHFTSGQIWLGALGVLLTVIASGCFCCLCWKVLRRMKQKEEMTLLSESKQD